MATRKKQPALTEASLTLDESRNRLEKFVEQLRALADKEKQLQSLNPQNPFPPSISFNLIEFMVEGLERYLAGSARSLDQAFRLKRPGRPKSDLSKGKHFATAEKAFWGRNTGKSWESLCDETGYNDPRELKRIVKRYSKSIIDKVCAEMAPKLTGKS